MAQPELYPILLRSITNSIAADLFPDLKLPKTRAVAVQVIWCLNRIVADIDYGSIGDHDPDGWAALLAAAPAGVATSAAATGDTFTDLDAALVSLTSSPPAPDAMPEADAWLARVSAQYRVEIDAIEASLAPIPELKQSLEADEEPSRLRTQLTDYLVSRFPSLGKDPIESFHIVLGGKTKKTAIFALRENDELPTRLVLRLDFLTQTGTRCCDEYPLLRLLFDAGLPVPEPIAVEEDATPLGGTFVLMREIVDAVPGGHPFPELNDRSAFSRELGLDIARTLAKLHRVNHDNKLPGAEPITGNQMTAKYLADWRGGGRTSNPALTDAAFAWLVAHPLPDDRPVALVHGDVGAHNLLVGHDGRLASLIDWELASLGDPAADLGLTKLWLLDFLLPWGDFVAEYLAAGGDPAACDSFAVSYFGVLMFARYQTFMSQLRAALTGGVLNDVESVNTAFELGYRIQDYLSRALTAAVSTAQ